VGQLAKDMLSTVVTSGTGKAAQVGDEFIWGKTGTTENYGDAWFAGGNEDLSVAIWVGYADRLQPMETEHGGAPVAGGTYPAEIFHDFMTSWLTLRAEREANRKQPDDDAGTSTIPAAPVTPSEIPPAEQAAPADGAPAEPDTGDGGGATPAPQTPQQPPEQAPAPNPAPAPAPAPTTPPSTGDGTGGGVGAAPP
jgi:penicillin-binding protein 1A